MDTGLDRPDILAPVSSITLSTQKEFFLKSIMNDMVLSEHSNQTALIGLGV